MGIEDKRQQEGSPEVGYKSAVASLENSVKEFDELLASEGGVLPERRKEVEALQNKFLTLHATAF